MFRLTIIPLLTGLIPIVAVHATYLISANQGFVPWCFPYIDSCSSISATGRYGMSFYVFKGTMIPAACLMISYWILTYHWLLSLGDRRGWGSRLIPVLGILAALFLILYAIALGAGTEYFRLLRRIGVILYFTFTYLSQLLLTYRLGKLLEIDKTRPVQLVICYSVLAIGLLTLVLDVVLANYEDYEDAFEWTMAVPIHLYFVVTWFNWRATRFQIGFSSAITSDIKTHQT